jgi:hypothetical protein
VYSALCAGVVAIAVVLLVQQQIMFLKSSGEAQTTLENPADILGYFVHILNTQFIKAQDILSPKTCRTLDWCFSFT